MAVTAVPVQEHCDCASLQATGHIILQTIPAHDDLGRLDSPRLTDGKESLCQHASAQSRRQGEHSAVRAMAVKGQVGANIVRGSKRAGVKGAYTAPGAPSSHDKHPLRHPSHTCLWGRLVREPVLTRDGRPEGRDLAVLMKVVNTLADIPARMPFAIFRAAVMLMNPVSHVISSEIDLNKGDRGTPQVKEGRCDTDHVKART